MCAERLLLPAPTLNLKRAGKEDQPEVCFLWCFFLGEELALGAAPVFCLRSSLAFWRAARSASCFAFSAASSSGVGTRRTIGPFSLYVVATIWPESFIL